MQRFVVSFLMSLTLQTFAADKPALDYKGKPIHPGCVKELITELNGDHVVGAVNLSGGIRACGRANRFHTAPEKRGDLWAYDVAATEPPQPDHKPSYFGYQNLGEVAPSVSLLKAVDFVDGSMGASVDYLLVRIDSVPFVEVGEDGSAKKQAIDRLTLVGRINPHADVKKLGDKLKPHFKK